MLKRELQQHAKEQADEINKRGAEIHGLALQHQRNHDRMHHMSNEMQGMRDYINKLEEDKYQIQRFIELRFDMIEAEEFDEERRFLRALLNTIDHEE
jgi:hypothetical protein